MRTRFFCALTGLFLLNACSTTGPSIDDLHGRLSTQPLALTPRTLGELAQLQPQASGPLRLAIAPPVRASESVAPFWPGLRLSDRGSSGLGSWTSEEADVIERWCAELREEGLIAEASFLPNLFLAEYDGQIEMLGLREAAARQGADAVLIVETATGYEDSANALAFLDITLVGGFIFPGHRVYSRTVMQGMVLDVQNEFVYAAGRGDAEKSERAAGAYAEQTYRKLRRKTRGAALDDLARALVGDLES